MTFEVKFSVQATKFLRKQDRHITERIRFSFKKLAKDPFQYLEHFEGESHYKFRIGDYRALVDVDFNNHILFVRLLDKRGRIYKR